MPYPLWGVTMAASATSRKTSDSDAGMNRRNFLFLSASALAASALPASAWALDRQHRITIARLTYPGGNDDPRPGALRRLLQEVDKRTSIEVDTSIPAVAGSLEELFHYPLVWMTGDRGYDPLDDETISALRAFLHAGGFLFVDSAEGLTDGPFNQSVERTMGRIFPDRRLRVVPRDHTLHQSFYLIDRPVGRIDISGNLRAIEDGDRLSVVVNSNDLLGALARDTFGNWEYNVSPGGERQRELAYRLAINVVMYALTINYKADQVHIPFILRRRRWRVD